jgi:hypothetical protein
MPGDYRNSRSASQPLGIIAHEQVRREWPPGIEHRALPILIGQHLIAQARTGIVRGPHLFALSCQLIGQRLAGIKPMVLIVEPAAIRCVPRQLGLAPRPHEALLAWPAAGPRIDEVRTLRNGFFVMQEGEDFLLLGLLFDLLCHRGPQQIWPDVQSRPLRNPKGSSRGPRRERQSRRSMRRACPTRTAAPAR